MKRISTLLLPLLFFTVLTKSYSQQIAFPGAEGAGRFASGGRGTPTIPTTVYEVTSLADGTDNDVGTFRWAVRNNSPAAPHRTIVFRISGTIRLNSALVFNRANTTVAGQTAPGDGICIADYPVTISANNVIIRYLRFRMGDKANTDASDFDALSGRGRKNIIIDHCSVSWGIDENLSFYENDSSTIQWTMITEPLNRSYHNEGSGYQVHGYGGIWGGKRVSFHHNLIAHVTGRTPRFDGIRNIPDENADYRNNVIYNWSDYTVNGGEGGKYNIVNNYYKYGPSTPSGSRRSRILWPSESSSIPYGKFYLDGNYVDGSPGVTEKNWTGVLMGSGDDTSQARSATPFDIAPVTTHSATDAYNLVLQNVGAILPKRDTLDERIINNVINRTGQLIDVQGGYPAYTPYAQTLSAWPTLNSAPAPADTDHDGMPDSWETANGLNPNNASDRNTAASDGYTMLEKYLNYIVEQAALPLKLISFNGSVVQRQVRLTWITSKEVNTANFSIERSADGRSFSSIGVVEAANNSANTSGYSFTDVQPLTRRTYYRLKMNDKDGKYTLSPVISFNATSKGLLTINPNPVENHITLSHSIASDKAQVQVYTLDGKLKLSYKLDAGSVQSSIDVSNLAQGLYSLVLINNNERTVQKFLKQ